MKFGTIIHPTEQISENKTKQVTTTVRKGVKTNVTTYKERIRVNNETEELAAYIKHKKEHVGQNIEFHVVKQNDPKKDYYHVVKVWEE